jgi:hypothetical protein
MNQKPIYQKTTPLTPITARLSGVSFRDAQPNIRQFGCAAIGTYALIREPENQFDPNAIQVSLGGVWFMGYVPSRLAKILAPMIDAGRTFLAEFVCRNEAPGRELVGLTVRIVETTKPAFCGQLQI